MLMPEQSGTRAAVIDAAQNYCPADGMVLVVVRPGYEQTARDSLRRRGVGAWWPNYPREVQAKDGQTGKRYARLVLTGIMPGIVLSPSRLNAQFWAAVDLAPGAVNVVRKLNGDALVIDDVDVVLLHKIEAELNRPAPAHVAHSYQAGDTVVIVGDIMRHFSATVIKVDRSGHIHLEIPMFGRATSLTVLSHQVAPA